MKKRFILFSIVLQLTLAGIIQAQNFPMVLITDENSGKQEPLHLYNLSVDVKVIANLATTAMSMTFYNDLPRILEGELNFPLGEGQTVSRFAMDVDGKLREGVVVEKAKGRQVFESIVRQGIDPGLLEMTKGNSFKSRIYPIPAKGYKKIVIAYEQELLNTEKGFLYSLPLNFKNKVDEFSIRAEVFKQTIVPDLGKNELSNFEFKKWNESYLAETKYNNYLPNKSLIFMLPKDKNRQKIFVETDQKNENYFFINIEPDVKEAAKNLPKSIALLWDVSTSAASKDVQKELDILEDYFKKIGDLKTELITFSNTIHSREKFEINKGNTSAFITKLKNLNYDGGTQLGILNLNEYPCDEIIICTDGISNFGKEEITLSEVPVVVINSSLNADHSYLKYIAQSTAGVYLNLNTLTVEQGLDLLTKQSFTFISATYDIDEISETYPSIPVIVKKDFSISGKLKSETAEIMLNFGFGKTITDTKTININKTKNHSETGVIKRIWGQKKIAELDILYDINEMEITSLAKELSIVTRNTSLIVLDRLEDYVEYQITPPDELKEDYYSALAMKQEEIENTEKNHLEEVVQMFQQRQTWWNTVFPMDDPKVEDKSKKDEEVYDEMNYEPQDGDRRVMARQAMEQEVAGEGILSEITSSGSGSGSIDNIVIDDLLDGVGSISPAKSLDTEDNKVTTGKITLKGWDPDTPYLKALADVVDDQLYTSYLIQKKNYGNSSAFFLDMSDFFLDKNKPELVLRILSNIAEMELENHQLLRILGHRLNQLGKYELASYIFEDVLEIREEDPQSYRDLGITYAAIGKYQKAIEMLYTVVRKNWDDRFPEIELIALDELNAIIENCNSNLDFNMIDKRLIKNLPVDIRVVLNWDADNTDMDLWIIDPNKEKCYYENRDTYLGGHLSRDFTGGYGPEEFILKKAKSGKYSVKVDYYGNQQQTISGATTIQVELILNFGKANEQRQAITLRLKDVKEVVEVAEFEFNPGSKNDLDEMKLDSRAKSKKMELLKSGIGVETGSKDGYLVLGLLYVIALMLFLLYRYYIAKKLRKAS